MAEDSTQKLSWTAASNKTWIKISTGGTAAQQIAGEGTTDVTITVTPATRANEPETTGTVTFSSAGLEDIIVKVERCVPECKIKAVERVYSNVICGSYNNCVIGACGGKYTVRIPYTDWIYYEGGAEVGCGPYHKEETEYEEKTYLIGPNNGNFPKENSETIGDCECENHKNCCGYIFIWQEAGPCEPACTCDGIIPPNDIELSVGENKTVNYTSCTDNVVISTGDENIASVSSYGNGSITILGAGTGDTYINIESTDPRCSKQFSVHVDETIIEYDIVATPDKLTCEGGIVMFTAVSKNNS